MNRNQRKNPRAVGKRNNADGREQDTTLNNDEIEEVLPPKSRRNPFKTCKPMTNRCCYVTPDYKDVEQSTEFSGVDDQFHNLVLQQYDFDPTISDTIKQLKELKKVLCGLTPKVENCSQYVNQKVAEPTYVETADGSQWQSIDNADDIDEYLSAEKEDKVIKTRDVSEHIYISELPNVKVIVEKFSKFKRNDVELRKLEEKIVCIEYDVFEKCYVEDGFKAPIQKLRAYFSIKPTSDNKEVPASTIPSLVKRNFNINSEDLEQLNEKEIEIIDSKIGENVPYLDDLKRVLKRNHAITARKEKSSLDLMALYKMAKRESSILKEAPETNLLSKAELEEIKELVTNNCGTSKHGINRRTIKNDKDTTEIKRDVTKNIVSESIFAELLKNDPLG
ncbi:unnamed protein product [Euphydryas editha]|uniref:Uncharacterized protein n=1 Tax=Euphydryas editha TaxID=104508 RepID=A0AAU9TG97_EUPED|nr:unnamed protein product [Euphydryas editha]